MGERGRSGEAEMVERAAATAVVGTGDPARRAARPHCSVARAALSSSGGTSEERGDAVGVASAMVDWMEVRVDDENDRS